MAMVVYLQNPRSGCLLFPAPSVGRRPLEIKYSYPNTLGDAVSEYTVYGYGVHLQNSRSGCLFFHAPSVGRCPLEIEYTYSNTLSHAVSEYI